MGTTKPVGVPQVTRPNNLEIAGALAGDQGVFAHTAFPTVWSRLLRIYR